MTLEKHKLSKGSGGWFFDILTAILVILVVGIIGIYYATHKSDKSSSYPTTSSTPEVTTTPSNVHSYYDPVQRYGKEKVDSAQQVMLLAKKDCRIYEDDSGLVVEMGIYITDPNQRLAYVSGIADADVILQGETRNIYFYDPSLKQIAQADPLKGIRLID